MKNHAIIIAIIALLVGGAGGFFSGVQYQKSKGGSFPQGQFQNGQARPSGAPTRNGTTQGRPVSGEIISVEDNSITIKTQDGSSKIVIYSNSTKVNKTSDGSSADLTVGEQAMVIGTESTEGTVTAQTISIGTSGFQGMPGGEPTE